MIRALQKADIDSVTDIWLDTNLKAHDSIPVSYTHLDVYKRQ